jgi:hypothetical protein
MKKPIAALFAVILAAAAPAGAEEWNTMGPRAMGMGGAGVALSQGPLASYWNPAALGRASEDSYGGVLPVSVHAALTGTALAGANDLKNANNSCPGLIAQGAAGAATCQANVAAALAELSNPNNGLRVDGSAGGDFKVGKVAVFVNDFIEAGAVPIVDPNQATVVAGTNKSRLVVKGAQIMEFGAGYGHEIPAVPGLFVGGDLKLMRANVGYTDYYILQNSNSQGNIFNNLKDNAASSANVGLDAGALWDVNKAFDNVWWAPRVGVTGHNLNNPKFSQPGAAAADGVGGRYAVNPQARLGVAISPFHWWNLAADVDLTRNLTPVNNVTSRQLDLGTEVNIFNRSWINVPLRFGVARNLSAATDMLTIGAGINLLHLMIDFSGEASPQRIQTQTQGSSTKIPQELGASVSISLLFGGSEAKRHEAAEEAAPVKAENATPAPTVAPVPPTTPAAVPAKASNDLPPAQVEQIKQNAAQSQKELDQTKPAPTGN